MNAHTTHTTAVTLNSNVNVVFVSSYKLFAKHFLFTACIPTCSSKQWLFQRSVCNILFSKETNQTYFPIPVSTISHGSG